MNSALAATVLIFGLIVYMVVVPPAIDQLAGEMTPDNDEFADNTDLVHKVAVWWAPLFMGVGIIIWAFAAAARQEGYFGED